MRIYVFVFSYTRIDRYSVFQKRFDDNDCFVYEYCRSKNKKTSRVGFVIQNQIIFWSEFYIAQAKELNALYGSSAFTTPDAKRTPLAPKERAI